MRRKQRLLNLIAAVSEVADDPEQFRASFEATFAERVKQRRAAREEALKRAEERIRVYLLNRNDVRLRQDGEIWIAEHCDLDVFTQGDSIGEALSDLLSLSLEYVASLWELGRDALAKELVPHYDFIEGFGGAKEWEAWFRRAVNAKLSELDRQEKDSSREKAADSVYVFAAPDSIFEKFINVFSPQELSFAAQDLDKLDLDKLRKEYNENLIPLVFTKVHVTIKSDADEIILRFIGDKDLNGLSVLIYQLDNGAEKGEERQSITRIIKGNEVSFTLSELGLTILKLNRVAFQLKIGNQQVEGRL